MTQQPPQNESLTKRTYPFRTRYYKPDMAEATEATGTPVVVIHENPNANTSARDADPSAGLNEHQDEQAQNETQEQLRAAQQLTALQTPTTGVRGPNTSTSQTSAQQNAPSTRRDNGPTTNGEQQEPIRNLTTAFEGEMPAPGMALWMQQMQNQQKVFMELVSKMSSTSYDDRKRFALTKKRIANATNITNQEQQDVMKVVRWMMEAEQLKEASDYAICLDSISSSCEDGRVLSICSAVRQDTITRAIWRNVCKQVLAMWFDNPTPTSAMETELARQKERTTGESLESYYNKFQERTRRAIWMRTLYGKEVASEWMQPHLRRWIQNMNSWAIPHALSHQRDGMNKVYSTLCDLTAGHLTLDSEPSIQTHHSQHTHGNHGRRQLLNNMHEERKQMIVEEEKKELFNALQIQQQQFLDKLSSTQANNANNTYARPPAGDFCAIFNTTAYHKKEDCRRLKRIREGESGYNRRDVKPQHGYNTQVRTCYNCGQPGHISKYCPKRQQLNSPRGPPAPCRDFERGRCPRERCRFSHNGQQQQGGQYINTKPICKYFQQGNCNRTSCEFRHEKVNASYQNAQPTQQGQNMAYISQTETNETTQGQSSSGKN